MKTTIYLTLICTLLLFSCKARKKKTEYSDEGLSSFPENCLDKLNAGDTSVKPGSIKLFVYIKKITINNREYTVEKDQTLDLLHESDLIVFNDSFAFKFFHIQTMEYGKWKHSIRWDFFGKRDKCWNRIAKMSYSDIDMRKKSREELRMGINSFSTSTSNADQKPIMSRVDWNYGLVD